MYSDSRTTLSTLHCVLSTWAEYTVGRSIGYSLSIYVGGVHSVYFRRRTADERSTQCLFSKAGSCHVGAPWDVDRLVMFLGVFKRYNKLLWQNSFREENIQVSDTGRTDQVLRLKQ